MSYSVPNRSPLLRARETSENPKRNVAQQPHCAPSPPPHTHLAKARASCTWSTELIYLRSMMRVCVCVCVEVRSSCCALGYPLYAWCDAKIVIVPLFALTFYGIRSETRAHGAHMSTSYARARRHTVALSVLECVSLGLRLSRYATNVCAVWLWLRVKNAYFM